LNYEEQPNVSNLTVILIQINVAKLHIYLYVNYSKNQEKVQHKRIDPRQEKRGAKEKIKEKASKNIQ